MVRKIAVGDVMTRNFSSVRPDRNLLECAKQMVKESVGCLLVTENKMLKGLLTQKDILWAITKKPGLDLRSVRAIDIAQKKVAVIKPSADINEAFYKMKRYGFRRLPVLSNGEAVGLLTVKDILSVEPSFYSKTSDLFEIREMSEKMHRIGERANDESEGFCDNCGAFSDLLNVDSKALCKDCRDELY